jgi:hypothetical protein
MSPFAWKSQPSEVLAKNPTMRALSTGKTHSQVSIENAAQFKQKTGKSLGTVRGLSPAADSQIKGRAVK